jgi:hypothetical protein
MSLIWLTTVLVYCSTYGIVLPIAFGLWGYTRLSKPLKILLYGLIATFILDLLILGFLEYKNTFLYFFSAIDLVLYTFIFARLEENKPKKMVIIIVAALLLILLVFDSVYFSGILKNGSSNALVRLFILVLCISQMHHIFNFGDHGKFFLNPILWVSIGLSLYNAYGFLDVFNVALLNFSQSIYLQFYVGWCIITIFMFFGFCYAFFLDSSLARKTEDL